MAEAERDMLEQALRNLPAPELPDSLRAEALFARMDAEAAAGKTVEFPSRKKKKSHSHHNGWKCVLGLAASVALAVFVKEHHTVTAPVTGAAPAVSLMMADMAEQPENAPEELERVVGAAPSIAAFDSRRMKSEMSPAYEAEEELAVLTAGLAQNRLPDAEDADDYSENVEGWYQSLLPKMRHGEPPRENMPQESDNMAFHSGRRKYLLLMDRGNQIYIYEDASPQIAGILTAGSGEILDFLVADQQVVVVSRMEEPSPLWPESLQNSLTGGEKTVSCPQGLEISVYDCTDLSGIVRTGVYQTDGIYRGMKQYNEKVVLFATKPVSFTGQEEALLCEAVPVVSEQGTVRVLRPEEIFRSPENHYQEYMTLLSVSLKEPQHPVWQSVLGGHIDVRFGTNRVFLLSEALESSVEAVYQKNLGDVTVELR